jgi:ribonuclease R
MTERRADDATRDVESWLKCEFLQEHVGDEFDGVIAAVTSFGLFVELQPIYIEGLVHISALPGDYYSFDAAKQRLVGERSGRSYRLGGRVRVQVARVDLDDKKIDLELIETPSATRNKAGKPRKRKADADTPAAGAPRKKASTAKPKAAAKGKSRAGAGQAADAADSKPAGKSRRRRR